MNLVIVFEAGEYFDMHDRCRKMEDDAANEAPGPVPAKLHPKQHGSGHRVTLITAPN